MTRLAYYIVWRLRDLALWAERKLEPLEWRLHERVKRR